MQELNKLDEKVEQSFPSELQLIRKFYFEVLEEDQHVF